MDRKQLEQAYAKAKASADAALLAEPYDHEQAVALKDEAKGLLGRIKAMDELMVLPGAKTPETTPKAALTVVADETDKRAAGKTWTMGEFLVAVANDDRIVQPFRSNDSTVENGYDLTKALGPKAVGSLTQAKAITGMSESVPADGGFLVGTDRSNTIMSRVYNVGDLLRRADVTPLGPNSNGMTFFREAETSRVDGSRRGGIRAYWASEGAEKTASQPTFEKLELSLNKVIGLVYATDELLQDATALEGWIMSNLPEELRFVAEDAMVNGTGAGQPQGVLSSPALVSVAAEAGQTAATIVAQNAIKMWARRYIGARDYIWLTNQDTFEQRMQMAIGVGTGGELVYMPPGGISGSPYGSIFGAPVIESEYSATLGTVGDLLLISWREARRASTSDSSMTRRAIGSSGGWTGRASGQPH
jgi:HK97 family phage major capsid protein